MLFPINEELTPEEDPIVDVKAIELSGRLALFRDTIDLARIQREHFHWVTTNFGDKRRPFEGVVEEVGELLESALFLIEYENGRDVLEHFPASREQALEKLQESVEGVGDAIGDVMVYTMDLCQTLNFNLEEILVGHKPYGEFSLYHGPIILGHMAHSKLKWLQGIRGTADEHAIKLKSSIARLFYWLDAVARHHVVGPNCAFEGHLKGLAFPLEEAFCGQYALLILDHVWQRVSKRDWKKNALTGDTAINGVVDNVRWPVPSPETYTRAAMEDDKKHLQEWSSSKGETTPVAKQYGVQHVESITGGDFEFEEPKP